MDIYFLGPPGTFSHILARQVFKDTIHSLVPANSFQQIFKEICDRDGAVGIIPMENSITSNVHENVDRLFVGDLKIVGEAFLEITLHLLGSEDCKPSEVKTLYSHPKALEQCAKFLSRYRGAVVETSSTANAAQELPPGCALIGSSALAESAGLSVLQSDIGDISQNSTRFVFVSQSEIEDTSNASCNRLTFTFQVRHEPGALVKVLKALGETGANLTKIESRPIPGRDWEYLFWVDLEISPEQRDDVCKIVKDNTLEYQILGCYPGGNTYSS
jgi:prephenate dehydratase